MIPKDHGKKNKLSASQNEGQGEVGDVQESSSRRGVGQSWDTAKEAGEKSQLFGAGGETDGTQASLINTTANRMLEDEAALYGQGERAMDENKFNRSHANANVEFNYSQYKDGAHRLAPGGEGRRRTTFLKDAGLSSGDYNLKIDPRQETFDRTTQALGAIYGTIYKKKERANTGYNDGLTNRPQEANPFMMDKSMLKASEQDAGKDDEQTGLGAEPMMEGEADSDDEDLYYDNGAPYAEKDHINQVAMDAQTGLRRVNMKSSQSQMLARSASKDSINEAYNEANSAYARVLREYYNHAYMTKDDRKDTLTMLRNPMSRYQAAQVGVGDVSRKTVRGYKTRRGGSASKLNMHLVGV